MGRSPTQWGTPQSRRAGGPAPRGALLVPATSRHVHVHVPVALQAEAAICENNRLLFIAAHNVGPPEIWIGGLCQVSVLLNACSICQSSSCQQQRQARLRRWRCLSCARACPLVFPPHGSILPSTSASGDAPDGRFHERARTLVRCGLSLQPAWSQLAWSQAW